LDVWKNTVNHLKKTEIKFLAKQNSFDELIDGLTFVVNTGSSDEESDRTTSGSDGSDSDIQGDFEISLEKITGNW
jgi:hypothetical protein